MIKKKENFPFITEKITSSAQNRKSPLKDRNLQLTHRYLFIRNIFYFAIVAIDSHEIFYESSLTPTE